MTDWSFISIYYLRWTNRQDKWSHFSLQMVISISVLRILTLITIVASFVLITETAIWHIDSCVNIIWGPFYSFWIILALWSLKETELWFQLRSGDFLFMDVKFSCGDLNASSRPSHRTTRASFKYWICFLWGGSYGIEKNNQHDVMPGFKT